MLRTARRRTAVALALVSVAAGTVSACTGDAVLPTPPHQLVFFDSCPTALAGLRAAAKAMLTPYGLNPVVAGSDGTKVPTVVDGRGAAPPQAANGADGAQAAQPQAQPADATDHSNTNVHEQGVDEPDLVKTDGRRIVTISGGRLSVVDVATRRLVGVIDLSSANIRGDADLLLAGDHALVYGNNSSYTSLDVTPRVPNPELPQGGANTAADPVNAADPVAGATVLLVDLTTPRVLSSARADGYVVDARQVGSTVRLITRSTPRLAFPNVAGTDEQRLDAYRAIIDAAGIDAWAPRLDVTTNGQTTRTQVGCDAISHPAFFSGENMLTVLSFDLNQPALTDGAPVSIVADGDTVYSNGTSLYVASGQAWLNGVPALASVAPQQPRTEIYRFDTSTPRPRYVAGGSVPGQLLNQYAMSEWNGYLRVATTSTSVDGSTTQSGVYVLTTVPQQLVQVGAVEGIGQGQRIYAVRFVGPTGYVVTFLQTDPLYTLDLRDPTAPTVRGELHIPGYSAYLHPIDDTHLIGIGQDAHNGQALGTQVSLFDVSDLTNPTRLAKFELTGSYSEAEVDPHAFLYWPALGLMVVPLQLQRGARPVPLPGDPVAPYASAGALVLRIHDNQISEAGFIAHPTYSGNGQGPAVRRSLVTVDAGGNTTLWTVSDTGLQANDASTLARLAWIPL